MHSFMKVTAKDLLADALDAHRVGLADQLIDRYCIQHETVLGSFGYSLSSVVKRAASDTRKALSFMVNDISHDPVEVEAKAIDMLVIMSEHAALQLLQADRVRSEG